MAEKILKSELSDVEKQKTLIEKALKNFGIIRLSFTKHVDFETLCKKTTHKLRLVEVGTLQPAKVGDVFSVNWNRGNSCSQGVSYWFVGTGADYFEGEFDQGFYTLTEM